MGLLFFMVFIHNTKLLFLSCVFNLHHLHPLVDLVRSLSIPTQAERERVTFSSSSKHFYTDAFKTIIVACVCVQSPFTYNIANEHKSIHMYIFYITTPHAHIPNQMALFLLVFSSLGIFECKNELNEDITFKGFFVVLFIRPIFIHPSMLHGYIYILRYNTIYKLFPTTCGANTCPFFLYPFQSSQ